MTDKNEFKWYEVLRVDEPNLNGNVYSKEAVEKAIEEFNNRTKDKPELGRFMPKDQTKPVKLTEASHFVKRLKLEDNFVYAKIKILDNHHMEPGAQLRFFLENLEYDYNKIRFAPISICSVKDDGVIKDDLKFIAFDYILINKNDKENIKMKIANNKHQRYEVAMAIRNLASQLTWFNNNEKNILDRIEEKISEYKKRLEEEENIKNGSSQSEKND